ncbi:MAG: GNAT family N-acetyltransferase [Gaiellaceae bacterium]
MIAVPYEPARREQLFALMRAVWGEEPKAEEFEWDFERNPTGPKLVTLVEDSGETAGCGAMTFAPALVEGEEAIVPAAVWMATHPEHRGKGVFQFVELENERLSAEAGAPLAIGFTNPAAGPIYVAKLDWVDVYKPRLWARVLRPVAAVQGLRGRGSGGGGLPPSTGARVERFGPAEEASYRCVSAGWPSHVIRSAEHLNWRYAAAPKDYRLFSAPGGYAVLGHASHHGISSAVVADLVAPGPREARALLRRCLREARGGADVAIGIPPPGLAPAYLSLGFLPTHMTIRVIGKALTREVPRSWYFALGDTDIF